jgi:lysophospholipase L1-like esterase
MKFLLAFLVVAFCLTAATADTLSVVVLGSSTAAGTGPLHIENAWVNRYRDFLQEYNPSSQVINLARGGYTTYHIMPNGSVPPLNRPSPDIDRNISQALGLNPSAIIINLPSNDAAFGHSIEEQLANYDLILATAQMQNVPVWITTSQPRNLTPSGRDNLMRMRDSTFARFQAIDFWYELADPDGRINSAYDSGDGIHLNDAGHGVLFERVLIAGVGLSKYEMDLLQPQSHSELSGPVQIIWSPQIPPDSSNLTVVDLSQNNGRIWQRIGTTAALDTSITWETSNHPDGTRYKLRIISLGDSGIGIAESETSFIINNPGNGIPELEILDPQKGDVLSGEVPITWWADDADGDSLQLFLETQLNSTEWQNIATNQENDGQYIWDTQLLPNSPAIVLRIRCTDGIEWVERSTGNFTVANMTPVFPDIAFEHVSGKADGSISARIVQPEDVTGHHYQISFDDSSEGGTTYNVRDLDLDSVVVENAPELDGQTEGALFDGVRLLISDFEEPLYDEDGSGWPSGNSTLHAQVNNGTGMVKGIPYPADYEINIFEGIVDTSSNLLDTGEIPVNFKIQNISVGYAVDFVFLEQDHNQSISGNDQIFIIERDKAGEPILTWLILFISSDPDIPPQAGDVFFLKILKPFSNMDIFEFNSDVELNLQNNLKQGPAKFQLRQNYPNPFNPTTTIEYFVPRRIPVTIIIYNILGQEVAELINDSIAAGLHYVTWDGRDAKGCPVGTGI